MLLLMHIGISLAEVGAMRSNSVDLYGFALRTYLSYIYIY